MKHLTQSEVEYLLNLIKELEKYEPIKFPVKGQKLQIDVRSVDGTEKFIIDVNRSNINIKKCTYQTRYQRTTVLLRIDLEGSPHKNPDGELIPCPHIHIYREGFLDKWAYPLSSKIKTDPTDLVGVLRDFLEYNNIHRRPPIMYQGDGLV